MKLGFLTACLPDRSLPEIAAWAAANGFEALEVAAWPDLGARPFTATHLDVAALDAQQADATRALFAEHGLTLSSIAFYDNNLHPDPTERKAVNDHVLACIDAAALARLPHRRHLRRPPPWPHRRREPARRRGGLRPAGRPRGRAGRQADHRELRDGGLAP